MTYRQEIICAAAGPMANLLLMLFPSRLFMVCNLLVLVFNLLPIEPLDGGKILGAVTARRWPLYQKAILDLAEILSALVLLLSGLLAGMFLPYGHRPAAFAIGLLIRACFFRMKTVQ